jgi:hypothetical protein
MPNPPLESRFLAALEVLARGLQDETLPWALTGSAGHALQGINLHPRDIDVQTDAGGAYRIAERFAPHVRTPVKLRKTAQIRSHYGVLSIAGVTVEIMGDIEKRLPDGSWTPPPDLTAIRRYVNLAGLTLPVLDLAYEAEAYALMGRDERAALLRKWLRGRRP